MSKSSWKLKIEEIAKRDRMEKKNKKKDKPEPIRIPYYEPPKQDIDEAILSFIHKNRESIESYSLNIDCHEIKLNIKLVPEEKL